MCVLYSFTTLACILSFPPRACARDALGTHRRPKVCVVCSGSKVVALRSRLCVCVCVCCVDRVSLTMNVNEAPESAPLAPRPHPSPCVQTWRGGFARCFQHKQTLGWLVDTLCIVDVRRDLCGERASAGASESQAGDVCNPAAGAIEHAVHATRPQQELESSMVRRKTPSLPHNASSSSHKRASSSPRRPSSQRQRQRQHTHAAVRCRAAITRMQLPGHVLGS